MTLESPPFWQGLDPLCQHIASPCIPWGQLLIQTVHSKYCPSLPTCKVNLHFKKNKSSWDSCYAYKSSEVDQTPWCCYHERTVLFARCLQEWLLYFPQKPLVNIILQSHSTTVRLSKTFFSSFWVLAGAMEIAPLCGSSLLHPVLALAARHPLLPCWLGSFSMSVALVRKLHHYNSHKPELSTLQFEKQN